MEPGILTIGIDRPPEHRIDPATFLELGKAFYRLDHEEGPRFAVLHTTGTRLNR